MIFDTEITPYATNIAWYKQNYYTKQEALPERRPPLRLIWGMWNSLARHKQSTSISLLLYINGVISSLRDVTCGVPQGSILGPILFLIYVNDLHYSMPNACLRLFADDTALVVNNSNIDTLIADVKHKLKMVHEWCTCNKLTINDTKANFVLFQMKNKPVPQNFTEIATEVMTIQRVCSAKHPGVVLME